MKAFSTLPICVIVVGLSCGPVTSGLAADTAATRIAQADTVPVVSRAPDVNQPMRDKWALIVGITQFANPKVAKLKFASKDAADFYEYLTHEGQFAPDHVRLLLNEKATHSRIMSELGDKLLTRMVKPDDLVVLFFSTHGSPANVDLTHKNFLVAYDSDPDDLSATGIDMQKMFDLIKERVPAERVLLMLDACYRSAMNQSTKGIKFGNFEVDDIADGSGKMVICSSQPDQQSWESMRYPNGVFTKRLLDALRGQGVSTPISQVVQTSAERVADEIKKDHPGAMQTPSFRTNSKGTDLMIAAKPAQPVEIPPTVAADLEPDSESAPGTEAVQPPGQPITLSIQYLANLYKIPTYSTEKEQEQALTDAMRLKNANFGFHQYEVPVSILRMERGHFDIADQELKDHLSDEGNDWQAMLARAYCFHKQGRQGEAEDMVKLAQFHNPCLPKDIHFGD